MADTDRLLSVRCLPVETSDGPWILRAVEDSDDADCPLYRVYGDTLLTEVFMEWRQWYSTRNDSCHYLGGESRRKRLTPTAPIPTSAFGKRSLGSVVEENDSGEYCRTYTLGSHGTYESTLPVEGELTFPGGVTLRAKAVTETRRMGNEETPDEEMTRESRRTRWFVGNDPLPVVLQVEERVIHPGGVVNLTSIAYTIDSGDSVFTEEKVEPSAEEILGNLEASLIGNVLRLWGDVPPSTQFEVSLADIRGMGVAVTLVETGTDGEVRELRLPALTEGRYVLTVRLREAERKMLLTRE